MQTSAKVEIRFSAAGTLMMQIILLMQPVFENESMPETGIERLREIVANRVETVDEGGKNPAHQISAVEVEDGNVAFWLIAAAVFILDRAVKLVALANLALGEQIVFFPGVLEWRLTHNQGMALGLLSGYPFLNLILPIAVVVLGIFVLKRYRLVTFSRVAMAFIAGGFLGNLFDRLSMGFVVDMVYFPWMPWYICNLADIAISCGVVLLAFSLLFRPGDWHLKTEEKAHELHHSDGTL